MNSKKNCLLVILVMWSSVLLFSAHARCPTRNDTHCTSINATQCPTDPKIELVEKVHLYELSPANNAVTINCKRSCGECYEDVWRVKLTGNQYPQILEDSQTEMLNTSSLRLTTRLIPAGNVTGCTSDSDKMVTSSLVVTLDNSSVWNTAEHLFVNCGIQCKCLLTRARNRYSLYAGLSTSAVVYLPPPVNEEATCPPAKECTCPPYESSCCPMDAEMCCEPPDALFCNETCGPECYAVTSETFQRSDVVVTWPNVVILLVIILIAIGIALGGLCIAYRCPPTSKPPQPSY